MLTEKKLIDQMEIVGPQRAVQVREATVIERDGEEISRTFHRYVLSVGDDLTGQPDHVKAICQAAWAGIEPAEAE